MTAKSNKAGVASGVKWNGVVSVSSVSGNETATNEHRD